MTMHDVPTRRSFIRTAGAALSAPLAAAAPTPAGAAEQADPLAARLAVLEDMHAIRALNQAFARHVNEGEDEAIAGLFAATDDARIDPGIRGLAADRFGEHDVIDIAADRQTATGLMHCTAQIEAVIGPSCPLVEMAREQGGGVVRRTEQGVFEHLYVRHGGIWKIRRSTYRPT